MTITPIYARILALMFVFLSLRVIGFRRTVQAALGDGGDSQLLRRQRVQGNFAEYVPFTLLLMAFAELQNVSIYIVHLTGLLILFGRCIHAYGVSRFPEDYKIRTTGMFSTFSALIIGALANLRLGVLIGL